MNNIRTLRGGEKATLDTTHPPILFSMGKQSLFWVEGHIRTSGFDIVRIRLISNTGQIL